MNSRLKDFCWGVEAVNHSIISKLEPVHFNIADYSLIGIVPFKTVICGMRALAIRTNKNISLFLQVP